ncbi:hypothetical protein H261_09327 [Paramagnetospirillum caucaseum]|uniref:Uncharacterized protein n=1 Tax=Paramagnetospirillum caucaseum TaxID=1244869 RepID=M3ACK0_9PROT|nr:hypothetical protein [Paramagnetospirillum caucaseum]EME70249.1 hypothetical protein H261_09327 [Paramagnetospirillum caucaseum]
MTGQSYRCIAMLSEARRLYDEGKYSECLCIIDSIRSCSTRCGEESACAVALRLAAPLMGDLHPAE